MDCPGCHVEMAELEAEDQVIRTCDGCGGLWLNVADLNRILLHHNMPGLESLGGKVNPEALTGQCSDCLVDLVSVAGGDKHQALKYDTCESCGGIFLEAAFEDAPDFKGAVAVIVGFFNRFSKKKKAG